MHISDRLQKLVDLLSELVASRDGMLILAGDVNIDMIKQQTSDVKRYTEMPSNHWTWRKSSPKQQELRSRVKRLLITLLPIFLNALHILMFSHVHSLAITTRHMFLFSFNQYLSRGIQFSRANEMEPCHNTKTKTLKLDN